MEQVAAPAAVVSKSHFAALINVSQGRVSQYIAEKKLRPPALVGKGRDQKIDVAEACKQLKRTLDVGQRLGNGIDTKLDLKAPAAESMVPASSSDADPVEEQIKRARLAQIEFQNRKAAEEEAARSGRLTDAEAAKSELGRLAVQMINLVEGKMPEAASAFAAKFQIPQRDALHLLRTEFREVRAAAAALIRQQASVLATTIPFEIAEPADSDVHPDRKS